MDELMSNHKFEIFADYFQLYLSDVETSDDTSDIWTEEAHQLKLGLLPSTIAIGTFRNVDVPVEVDILDSEPDINLEEWDHASVGSISINSGQCTIYGCTDYLHDAEKFRIKPGKYSVISLAKGLDSITEEWEDADDFYKIVIWPSSLQEYRSLKKYKNT
jgi:hypothetical protein